MRSVASVETPKQVLSLETPGVETGKLRRLRQVLRHTTCTQNTRYAIGTGYDEANNDAAPVTRVEFERHKRRARGVPPDPRVAAGFH